jgi:flagellar L-ring protein precursor FlgH
VDKITAKFGVRVVDVLPNNTMVIQGMRETSYGGETQVAILRGTVRREDIDASNMVMSERLADLQIRYVNTGVISDSQNKGWFMKFWDKVSPF